MKWSVGRSQSLYDCPWFRLELTDVGVPDPEWPGGTRWFPHHVIRTPRPAVGGLAHDATGRCLLMWRHRFITDRWGWEIPTGGAEADETIEAAAAREFVEEIGYQCSSFDLLARTDLSNGLSDQGGVLYLGRGASPAAKIVSREESSELRWMSRDDLVAILTRGDIRDAMTQIAVLTYLTYPR